jgi:iron complex outermembrane recepter protein
MASSTRVCAINLATAAVWVRSTRSISRRGGALVPRIDAFYQGRRTNGTVSLPQRDPHDIVPSYTLMNARLTFLAADGKWSASLSAENVLDKFYWAQLMSALQPNSTAMAFNRTGVPGRGREVGFTFRRTFD